MSWRELLSDYPAILRAYSAIKVVCYEASPCYVIPRMELRHKESFWADHGAYRVFGKAGSPPILIPTHTATPRDAMVAYMDSLHRYKGLTQVPLPYAMALEKSGFKVSPRPYGDIDFVMETDLLLTLPGGRFKTRRNELSKLRKEGYTCRPLTSDDVALVSEMERRWGAAYGKAVWRRGFATELTRHLGSAPADLRLQGLVLMSPTGETMGVSLGCQVSGDTWSCSFRFADNKVVGAALFLYQAMCGLFADLPYEADGSGGAKDSTLFDYKKRLIQRPDLLVQMFTVKK